MKPHNHGRHNSENANIWWAVQTLALAQFLYITSFISTSSTKYLAPPPLPISFITKGTWIHNKSHLQLTALVRGAYREHLRAALYHICITLGSLDDETQNNSFRCWIFNKNVGGDMWNAYFFSKIMFKKAITHSVSIFWGSWWRPVVAHKNLVTPLWWF